MEKKLCVGAKKRRKKGVLCSGQLKNIRRFKMAEKGGNGCRSIERHGCELPGN